MSDDDFPERDEDEAAASDAPAEVPEPRANPELSGHEAAEAGLLEAYSAGKLPHALIIGGPRGIGKATLAFRLARFLMAQGGETTAAGLFGARRAATLARPRARASGISPGRRGGPCRPHHDRARPRPAQEGSAARRDRRRRYARGRQFPAPHAGGGRLAHRHRRQRRRHEPQCRQCAAEDPRGAAAPLAADPGEPRAGPAAADHPLALPQAQPRSRWPHSEVVRLHRALSARRRRTRMHGRSPVSPKAASAARSTSPRPAGSISTARC